MASRAEQKAAARAAREARQRELSAVQARRARLIWIGGLVGVAALVIAIIALATAGNGPAKSRKAARAAVVSLLRGIPQSGNVLGDPQAPVTLTEYGDLVCPVCQEFALTTEQQLISSYVRNGTVKIVFRAAETASSDANGGEFIAGQVAARAAGVQRLEWDYIMLWYSEQQSEDTPYVTDAFLQGLAQQVPGLMLAQWQAARTDPKLTDDVNADLAAMTKLVDRRVVSVYATPTLIFSGPGGTVPAIQGVPAYAAIRQSVKAAAG
ncbi:MAG: thioredoxin domain-containing protein [Solirubrobacteraceae bacterium]|jgi:protein-disulfide isomerase